MKEIIETKSIKNKIYNIRGVGVMLDSEMSATKWHYYLFNKIIVDYFIFVSQYKCLIILL